MGYTHGQEIVPQADMLCVPVGSPGTVTWTSVSRVPTLTVIAEALKGALTHGSRAHTPLFSDDQFHNLAFLPGPGPDPGRAEGLQRLQQSLFRGTGPYADGPPVVRAEDYAVGKALMGSFRTPGLRELASTAPYGHNGVLYTLEEWLEHYVSVTSSPPDNMLGTLDPALAPVEITPQEKQELTDFLLSLSSAYASVWTQKPATLHGTPEP
jgi:hypothetical protein